MSIDNLHYEKHADGTVKSIEDEIPFEVPEGWEWTRLKSISYIGTGATPLKSHKAYYDNGNVAWITSAATAEPYISKPTSYITELALVETNCTVYQPGTLVIAMYGEGKTRGQISELQISAATNQACAAVSLIDKSTSLRSYIKCFFIHSYEELRSKAKGGQQPNLNQTIIADMLVPIPPSSELYGIMGIVDKALGCINIITAARQMIQNNAEKIKQHILSLAIRGQLVPQNLGDEPASELLDRIRAEKEVLIQQGKIKRDKRESIIFRSDDNSYYERVGTDVVDITEELPFPIPETWCWARMSTLFEINPRNKLDDSLEVSFIPMPLIEDGYSGKHGSEKRKWSEVRTGFSHFADGDIGIAKITPCFENRKSVVFQNLTNGFGAGTTELHVLRPYGKLILPEYALALVKTRAFIEDGKQEFTGAVGQQRIGKDFISEYLFPIPPYQEQERIVNAIEQIFHIINEIEQSIG